MRVLGSKVKTSPYRSDWTIGLTLSHNRPACDAARTRVDWAFVSPVPHVSAAMKLIDEYRMGDEEGTGRHSASYAGTGGTGATVAGI
jgi:hypothetical protein